MRIALRQGQRSVAVVWGQSGDAGSADERRFAEAPAAIEAPAGPRSSARPRGRPRSESPKRAVNLRLSQRVVDGFRAGGPGWQTRINAALEQWLDDTSGRER